MSATKRESNDTESSKEKDERFGSNWKALFYVVTFMLSLSVLLKCPLFITRQVTPPLLLLKLCPNDSLPAPTEQEEYVFTMVVYNLLFLGHFAEILVLQKHIYNFFMKCSTSEACRFRNLWTDGLTGNRWIISGFVVLCVYMLLHSLSVPALGIVLEVRTGSKCEPYVYEYHTVYWILDIFCYMYDVAVRLFMVLATLAVGRIWSEKEEKMPISSPAKSLSSKEKTSSNPRGEVQVENSSLAKCSPFTHSDVMQTSEEDPSNEIQPVSSPEEILSSVQSFSSSCQELLTRSDYLVDKEIVNQEYITKWWEYTRKGKEVKSILDMFKMWFILPWLLYFVSTSLNTDHILHVWKEDVTSNRYDFSSTVYLVYDLNQLLLLSLPYFCARAVNAYHLEYIHKSRGSLMKPHKTASRMALAYLNRLEQEEHYDFIPHLGGTNIKITVENPIYTMFLLVGFFFAVVHNLVV